MKKRVLFLLFGGVIVATVLVLLFLPGSTLKVIDATPKNNATLNPFSPVVITFNQKPPTDKSLVTVSPTTDVTVSATTNNTITITPITTFLPLTTYKITVNTKPPYILSFQTEQVVSNAPGWNDEFAKQIQTYQQQNGAQDAALIKIRKNTPLKLAGFAVDYSYGNNTYTVSLSAPYEVNRAAFLSWFASVGVTDTSKIRIQYVNL